MPDDVSEQARQVLHNLVAVVVAAGSRKDLIVKCTCYLRVGGDFATFNRVYREFFTDYPQFPARTTVVTQLVRDGVRVEIDGAAAVARKRSVYETAPSWRSWERTSTTPQISAMRPSSKRRMKISP
ncbi:RidA family protein [Streptomyces sp. NPDC002076]